jgi:drug/metabolite transporter (DMT)-like permease
MSLLYTYPLWNLIFANFFRDEKIKRSEYGLIGLATVGSILLNMDPGMAAPTALGRTANSSWGLLTGIVMALTESGMVTILKALDWRDPAKSVWVVNTSATLWIGAILFIQELFIDGPNTPAILRHGTWWDAILLTAFHSLTIFSGYWLRFYAVPRLSSVTYAILSYAGLFASYLFGLLILKETPGWMSLVGAAIIVASGLALQVTAAK